MSSLMGRQWPLVHIDPLPPLPLCPGSTLSKHQGSDAIICQNLVHERTVQEGPGGGGTCSAFSWTLGPLPCGGRRWPCRPGSVLMCPFASLAGSRGASRDSGANLLQPRPSVGQGSLPHSCAPRSWSPHSRAAGGRGLQWVPRPGPRQEEQAKACRWEAGGRGWGRWRETPGRPRPLPAPSLRAAGDSAPPGQGAEKTATGGEEAAAEAGFGVSLRSSGGGGPSAPGEAAARGSGGARRQWRWRFPPPGLRKLPGRHARSRRWKPSGTEVSRGERSTRRRATHPTPPPPGRAALRRALLHPAPPKSCQRTPHGADARAPARPAWSCHRTPPTSRLCASRVLSHAHPLPLMRTRTQVPAVQTAAPNLPPSTVPNSGQHPSQTLPRLNTHPGAYIFPTQPCSLH